MEGNSSRGTVYALHRSLEQSDDRKTRGERCGANHQLLRWSNFPMTLDTRWGRVGPKRTLFERLRRLLFLSEQDEGPLLSGFPVPVGTAGDITLVDDAGLRVLDGEILVLVPLSLPPSEDVTKEAIGPPGKVYWKPGS